MTSLSLLGKMIKHRFSTKSQKSTKCYIGLTWSKPEPRSNVSDPSVSQSGVKTTQYPLLHFGQKKICTLSFLVLDAKTSTGILDLPRSKIPIKVVMTLTCFLGKPMLYNNNKSHLIVSTSF